MISNPFFCPDPMCKNHTADAGNEKQTRKWYRLDGYHFTKAFGLVQRYKCLSCGKGFSDQTFSLNYFLKIKTNFKSMFDQFNSSNSDCFIGRHFKMSFDSVQNRRNRMARNSIFLQSKLLEEFNIEEDLCADGFESYTKSKYFPNNINILVGKQSGFLYYFTESVQKRKGCMTENQKNQCTTEYEDKSFTESTLEKQFTELLTYLKGKVAGNTLNLFTDKHKTYVKIIKTLNMENNLDSQENFPFINHVQTSSKEPRTNKNPLFMVNYLDRQFRKDIANHRRKTICQARNDRNMLSRMACYMVSHNFFKPKNIKSGKKQVNEKHYNELRLNEKEVTFWKSIFFTKRFFLSKVTLPDYFKQVWTHSTPTPMQNDFGYVPKFACA